MKRSREIKHNASQNAFNNFPARRFYTILMIFLIIISIVNVSLKTEEIGAKPWILNADLKVSSLTLTLLLFAWLPIVIPWILTLTPGLRNFFTNLRESGIEEIETNILKLKFAPGVRELAKSYDDKIQKTSSTLEKSTEPNAELENAYKEINQLVSKSELLPSLQAWHSIDQLSSYYDLVRKNMPSGGERTRLMLQIASTIWSLMPSIQQFPLFEKLCSPKGGERLSAYKYIEWKPDDKYLDILLSRAIGVLEEPFGQYSALLALRRVVVTISLNQPQRKTTLQNLKWAVSLSYIGQDRRALMGIIISVLENNA